MFEFVLRNLGGGAPRHRRVRVHGGKGGQQRLCVLGATAVACKALTPTFKSRCASRAKRLSGADVSLLFLNNRSNIQQRES